jgi:hypothetical protein
MKFKSKSNSTARATDRPVDQMSPSRAARRVDPRIRNTIGIILNRMAAELHEAAKIFNQTGRNKVEVTCLKRVAGGESMRLMLNGCGFEFVNHKADRVQIFDISKEASMLYSEVYPFLDSTGAVAGWKEKQIHAGGKYEDRTLTELTNSYLLLTVRKCLERRKGRS